MTLREALAEILTPAGLAALVDQELEKEYIAAAALCVIARRGGPACDADQALIAWCRVNGSVWIIEDGDRRLEGPPSCTPRSG